MLWTWAVGVIIGGAFSGIVTSLTDNFINPILNLLTGGATYTMTDVAGFASSFVSAVVNFLIMALILFCLMKGINKLLSFNKKEEAPAEPTTKTCPFCQSEISIKQPLSTLYFCIGRKIKAAYTVEVIVEKMRLLLKSDSLCFIMRLS